jgi:hypothetical protein
MNSTFGIWLIGAGAVAIALLLLLGAPVAEQEPAPELAQAEDADVGSSYWQPVVEEAPTSQTTYVSTPGVVTTSATAPYSSCGATTSAVPPTTSPSLVGGCGYPSVPCGKPPCSPCRGTQAPVAAVAPVPETSSVPLVGGCGRPSAPCASTPCAPLTWGCYDACADPCRVMKPGINRNMPLCVDECSFVQLHSTVSHPICGQVRFEWSASKGWFLDPTASDPLYFAPTTQFCNGEDVWITLLVTDASGAQYSDVVSLHVRDLP